MIWFLLLLSVFENSGEILVKNEVKILGNKLLYITENNFKEKDIVTVYASEYCENDDVNFYIEKLQTQCKHSLAVITRNITETFPRSFRSDVFIIQYCELHEVSDLLAKIPLLQMQKFFLVPQHGQKEDFAPLVKLMWSFYLSNFVIVSTTMDLYTWFPFDFGNCENNFHKLFKLSDNLFPNKTDTLNKCPVRIKFHYEPPLAIDENNGAQVKFMQILAEKYNFTPIMQFYNETNETEFITDYLFQGLNDHTSDLALPFDSLTVYRHYKYDYSGWYYEDGDIFCGKAPQEVVKWVKLAQILLSQFYNVSIPLLVHVLATYVIAKIIRTKEGYKSLINIFTYYILSVIGVGNQTVPKRSILRILYSAWLLFSLVFSVNYTSVLFQNFQKPLFEVEYFGRKLETFKILLPMYYNSRLLAYVNADSEKKRFDVCNHILDCSARVIKYGDCLFGTKNIVVVYYAQKHRSPKGSSYLNCFRFKSSMNYLNIIMNKNYFLKRNIDDAVGHLTAAKIFNIIMDDIMHVQWIRSYNKWAATSIKGQVSGALKFHDFMVIFIYIFGALMIALGVFIMEHFYFWIGRRILYRIKRFLKGTID